ncbi:hypothetical protein HNQ80_003704 [Anaerosolibacter carboniphilus]|uniref:Uncharacterized protein n=1 Tax=Anaerosolibacter carboniphilus TaxID=1417629 RepID=A0A841KVW7_9FIRM|nr:hypothetical protein [Anaerosolibacter carboniphilus]MBB6217581.1 hypothetical protein [Anaerosolibacter carboniphilus]
MGEEVARQAISLFNMDYLSSVTTMVLAVNLITQVIKEIFLDEKTKEMIPKLISFMASFIVIGVHHYTLWTQNPAVFNQSLIEFVFLVFLNTILIAGLSMGNYKVLNLTKEKEIKRLQTQAVTEEKEPKAVEPIQMEERGELH